MSNLKSFLPKSSMHLLIASVLAVILSLVSTVAFLKIYANGKQVYHDIIAGNIVWSDQFKSLDYSIVYCFILCFCLFLIPLIYFVNKKSIAKIPMNPSGLFLSKNALICFFLLFYAVSFYFFSGNSSFIYVAILLFITYFVIVCKKTDTMYKEQIFISFIVSLTFSYFAIITLHFVYSFFNPNPSYKLAQILPEVLTLLIWMLQLAIYFYAEHLLSSLTKILMYSSQLILPFITLVLVFGVYQTGSKIELHRSNYTLAIMASIASILFIYTLLLILKHRRIEVSNVWDYICWPSLIPLTIIMLYSTPVYGGFVSDDFHLGEIFMPLQQMLNYGMKLNVDVMSIQGIMGPMYSLVNDYIFNGNLSSINYTFVAFPIIIGTMVVLLIKKLYGSKWAFLFIIFSLPILFESGMNRTYLIIPYVLILFHKNTLSNPVKWVIFYFWMSLIHCLYNPSMGAALTLAFLPLFGLMLYRSIKLKLWSKVFFEHRLLFCSLVVIQLCILAMLFPTLWGTVQFILDNGSANTLAYGISLFSDAQASPDWFPKPFPYDKLNRLLWESIRIGGWVSTLLLFVGVTIFNVKKVISFNREKQTYLMILYCTISIVFLILITGYSLGRLDSGSMHRSGSITFICFAFLIPALYVFFLKNKFNSVAYHIYLIVFAVLLGSVATFGQQQVFRITEKLMQPMLVPDNAIFVNGAKQGIPDVGEGFIAKERWKEMLDFESVLAKMLKEGETYADLTNRTLFYEITNKRVPTFYSADYLAANEEIQEKMIKNLDKEEPPLVFIGPAIRHDGGPASIRAYRLYKWFLERDYVYYQYNSLQFLVSRQRMLETKAYEDTTNAGENELRTIFHQKDLKSLPVAWGRNFKEMRDRFQSSPDNMSLSGSNEIVKEADGSIVTNGNDPYVSFKLDHTVKGKDADFLLIDLNIIGTQEPFQGQLFWNSSNRKGEKYDEDHSFLFNVVGGQLLIPLGSDPDWLRNTHNELRFDIGDKANVKVRINSIQLVRLVK
ncbi:hypothetical protein B4V02_02600 [Paenibacillus kribbensis]|uniref:Uncharacterized protein n=1 Tax=Paenibacillus kribbensis TaxID=172713 RepID=A0A222WI48_9BACL|nr:hypothetical protein [Paenibacillus kribbensis]ASR45678.1 hypothetical protein B4V02_02600 [Paenibacillus kribbensis]